MDELLGAVRKDEESVGWGGWEISRNGKGAPDGFFHVHAYTLRRRKDRDGWVQKWMGEYRHFRDYGRAAEDTANPERFEGTNEILMFFETTPTNPFYGHPDHLPALGDMLGDESAQAYQQQFFLNNAVPRLAICVNGGRLDPDAREGGYSSPGRRAGSLHLAGPDRSTCLRNRRQHSAVASSPSLTPLLEEGASGDSDCARPI
jgi:capsid portal protein